MSLLLIAFLGGALTLLSPCILPVLPFVFQGAGRPFRSHGLPMIVGLAIAFCAAASLATVGGHRVAALHEHGRQLALAWVALGGLALLFPAIADRLARPLTALGERLGTSGAGAGRLAAVLQGVSTGLLWTPCAGPILGFILTAAALSGPDAHSTSLLAAYAAGAAGALAVVLLAGRRIGSALRLSGRALEGLRRGLGVAVLASVGALALGADVSVLGRVVPETTTALEQHLIDAPRTRAAAEDTAAPARADGDGFRPASLTSPASPAPAWNPDFALAISAGATGWINSAPLAPESLRGKVVLVNFWTYSCINCLRTLPYVRAWADRYKDAGLVVIGVHTPEFAFEKLPENVRRATRELQVGYPVALDSDYAIWRAFGNQYWPAFIFVDAQGHVRHRQFGEEHYADAEQALRQLLVEAGHGDKLPVGLVTPVGAGTQAAPGPVPAQSGETYLGADKASGFVSPGGEAVGRLQRYTAAEPRHVDTWSLGGDWIVEPERIVLGQSGGRIAYRFRARDLHLVLGPAADGKPVRFRVRIDGKAPQDEHGTDVDAQGQGTVDVVKLYQLVRRRANDRDALFEIEFLDPGVQAYVFTFG